NHRSFLIKGDHVERFSVARSDDYDISDCTILPPGDLLLLERRYSPTRGVAMRIRRVPLVSIKPDALVDGKPLIEADLAYQIDNMEGIAVHRNARGETIITLVSDDNFSVIQRNLLLQFTLVGE
ncbi:MAG TPA: esterase-like activity of phytase family protein, partial [Pseudolabrys sp.]